MNAKRALVVGGNSAIAQALIQKLLTDQELDGVHVFSRHPSATKYDDQRLHWHCGDYGSDSLTAWADSLAEHSGAIARVFIFNGVLHDDAGQPEKRLEDINADTLLSRLHSNTVTPMLAIQALLPLLRGPQPCVVAVLSARIGSIGDNQLGGWYSYRASKAALNMLLKTASIEFARRAKNLKLLSFHPGTTDSPLSAPFQHRVPDGKLFTPQFVAERLLGLCSALPHDGQLSYIDWQGKSIDW